MNTLVTFQRPLTNRFFSPMSVWKDFDEMTETFLRPVSDYDFSQTDDHYLLTMDIPGVKKEDLKIELQENELLISAVRSSSGARFERRFALPERVDVDKIEANLEDGVLHIVAPKTESAKPRRIEIKSGGSLWTKLLGSESKRTDKEV